jgi:hypothetical protein
VLFQGAATALLTCRALVCGKHWLSQAQGDCPLINLSMHVIHERKHGTLAGAQFQRNHTDHN